MYPAQFMWRYCHLAPVSICLGHSQYNHFSISLILGSRRMCLQDTYCTQHCKGCSCRHMLCTPHCHCQWNKSPVHMKCSPTHQRSTTWHHQTGRTVFLKVPPAVASVAYTSETNTEIRLTHREWKVDTLNTPHSNSQLYQRNLDTPMLLAQRCTCPVHNQYILRCISGMSCQPWHHRYSLDR